MGGRVIFTAIVAILAMMMVLAGGPAALAATNGIPLSDLRGWSAAPC